MAKTTDERIQNILRKNAEKLAATKQEKNRAEELAKSRQTTAAAATKKWAADTHVIEAILKDFEQKMSGIDLHLTFQSAGQQGSESAVGRIIGSVSGKEIEITLNVHPNGEIHTFASGPKHPNIQIEFVSPPAFSVLSADKAQYEAVILDYIERVP